jgi:type II secretion system protein C
MKYTKLAKVPALLIFLYFFSACPADSGQADINYRDFIKPLITGDPFGIFNNTPDNTEAEIKNRARAHELPLNNKPRPVMPDEKSQALPFSLEGLTTGLIECAILSIPNPENSTKPENLILYLNESFKGWKLVSINDFEAHFNKQGKTRVLRLFFRDKGFATANRGNSGKNNSATEISIPRTLLLSAAAQKNRILSSINIRPHVIKNQIRGFKLSRADHPLVSTLGLKKGDILEKIDNQQVTSIERAKKIGKKLIFSKGLNIEIRRNGKLKTIKYAFK